MDVGVAQVVDEDEEEGQDPNDGFIMMSVPVLYPKRQPSILVVVGQVPRLSLLRQLTINDNVRQ